MLSCWNAISKKQKISNISGSHLAEESNNKHLIKVSRLLIGLLALTAFTWGLRLRGQELPLSSSEPTVPAGSYTAGMLVSSLVQVMSGCGNGSTRLGTWPTDQLLSLASDCSHHDRPACWALSDPSHLTRPYPDLWTDFPASNLTCFTPTNLPDNLDAWLNLNTRCCSASPRPLPLAPGLTAMLALQSIFRVIWYSSGLVRWVKWFSSYKDQAEDLPAQGNPSNY